MPHEDTQPVRGVRTTLRPLDERLVGGRTLDERLSLRYPVLSSALGSAFMRLSPRSRLRRLVLARRIRQAYAAQLRRDYAVVLAGWDSESEYRPSTDILPPGLGPTFHGHEGMLELWRHWRDAFQDIRWDPEEVFDLGEKFLVTAQQSGHGSISGVEVSQLVFQLFSLRGGFVIRQEDFRERSDALEAAGVLE